MIKKSIMLMCIFSPLQGMLSRATKTPRVKAPVTATRYKTAATQVLQQRMKLHTENKKQSTALVPLATHKESPKQGLTPYQPPINNENNRRRWFSFGSPSLSPTGTKSSWGALMGLLGLGWLWYSQEDQEAEELLAKCKEVNFEKEVNPMQELAQFVEKYGDGPRADRLFSRMIQDNQIINKMLSEIVNVATIPDILIPCIARHYYTLACNKNIDAVYVLGRYVMLNPNLKSELTPLAIRDMEKLCKDAYSDEFLKVISINNQEAIDGFVQKAQGNVKKLVATKVGKQFVDTNLILQNMNIAKERATMFAEPSNTFDLPAFNTCMKIIKDDSAIEQKIKESYKKDDISSLLRKVIYQKYCEHCVKDDFSHISFSLRDLVDNIDSFASPKSVVTHNIIPNKGLSHMLMEALNTEAQYSDDYYVFYHGQSSKLGFQQRLFSWLVTRKDNVILPLIYPIQDTSNSLFDAKNLNNSTKPKYWGYDDKRPNYLYAGIGLFQHKYPLLFASSNSSAQITPNITTEIACKDAHQEGVYK